MGPADGGSCGGGSVERSDVEGGSALGDPEAKDDGEEGTEEHTLDGGSEMNEVGRDEEAGVDHVHPGIISSVPVA